MSKYKYYTGKLGFRTKKESYEYTRNIIYSIGVCDIDVGHEYFHFFKDLINNHNEKEEKIGVGIQSFLIRPNAITKNNYGMYIKRTDGSEIDFSWRACSQHTKKSNKQKLTSAMRVAIEDQIYCFREKSQIRCKFCGINDYNVKYEVDHHNPSFLQLYNSFVNTNKKKIPTEFSENPLTHQTIFKRGDLEFESAWAKYHKENCNLQILCQKCNSSKK